MKHELGWHATKYSAAVGHLICAPEDSAAEANGTICVARRRRCRLQLPRNEPELRVCVCVWRALAPPPPPGVSV